MEQKLFILTQTTKVFTLDSVTRPENKARKYRNEQLNQILHMIDVNVELV